jgi:hypothetical protein
MPLTAKFIADFSSFTRAVDQAEVELRGFESEAHKVERSLARMTDSFSGRRVIQDATLMARAIEEIGGASKLTDAELQRVGATAQEAVEKMQRLGQDVPASLETLATAAGKVAPQVTAIGTASTTTTASMGGFTQGLSTADRTLSALGVNIGPQIRALDELAAASGKSAASLGAFATAGAVAAAAVAGWQVGRMIADFLGLDKAIGDATASLLGFGDVAKEEAGAGADVLEKASIIAKRSITDFAEAQKILREYFAETGERLKSTTGLMAGWNAEIARAKDAGKLEALTADLKSQNFTLQELEKQYGISARAIEFFGREQEAAEDRAKRNTAALKDMTAEHEQYVKKLLAGEKELERTLAATGNAIIANQANITAAQQRTATEWTRTAGLMTELSKKFAPTKTHVDEVTQFYADLEALSNIRYVNETERTDAMTNRIRVFNEATLATGGALAEAGVQGTQAGTSTARAFDGAASSVTAAGSAAQAAAGAFAGAAQAAAAAANISTNPLTLGQRTDLGVNQSVAPFQTLRGAVGSVTVPTSASEALDRQQLSFLKAIPWYQADRYTRESITLLERRLNSAMTNPYSYAQAYPMSPRPRSPAAGFGGGALGLSMPSTGRGGGGALGLTVNNNMSGILMGSDPQARQQLSTLISDTVQQSMSQRGARL